jgi:ADP-ribosyl-[dinitrogen reductase] hydrolase
VSSRLDRVAGVLLGGAVGDALGVHYEFGQAPGPDELAEMLGGGLGNFAPGEWSDDTSMAVCIAQVVAEGADLTEDVSLDRIALGFLRWYGDGPPDIGVQTSAVLGRSASELEGGGTAGDVLHREAQAYAVSNPRSAGNGALMRTGPVALAHLDDRDKLARAARLVAQLTHADPLAGDSCVIWCEAIRVAVLKDAIDVRGGLDLLPEPRRGQWDLWLADALDVERNRAEPVPGARFSPNGFTVTALQAAVAAIVSTSQLEDALHSAVRIGNDTDTVAAIAGALLGARWGASAIPEPWKQAVHGWPGLTGADLGVLAGGMCVGGR